MKKKLTSKYVFFKYCRHLNTYNHHYLKIKLISLKHLFFVATHTIRCFYEYVIVLQLTKELRLSCCRKRSRILCGFGKIEI